MQIFYLTNAHFTLSITSIKGDYDERFFQAESFLCR